MLLFRRGCCRRGGRAGDLKAESGKPTQLEIGQLSAISFLLSRICYKRPCRFIENCKFVLIDVAAKLASQRIIEKASGQIRSKIRCHFPQRGKCSSALGLALPHIHAETVPAPASETLFSGIARTLELVKN